MKKHRIIFWILVAVSGLSNVFAEESTEKSGENRTEKISLRKTDAGYEILLDGAFFAAYVADCRGTPVVWPIFGPTGKKMTRDYPMLERNDKTEAKDHPHHRSLWFTHGEVNDSNFWHLEGEKVVHRKFSKAETDGREATLVTENDWIGKRDEILCKDVRTLRFGVLKGKNGPMRHIDFDITVTAVRDGVVFGDTKEGTFGVRIAGTMDLTAKKRDSNWGGHIVNAEGIKDRATWAKRSAWVDYYGPVEDETLGIAILNHPSSFRYPTYWHVRDYGLYAANPFGRHDFENKKEKTGEHKMNKGESFTLRYRVIFHTGDADSAGIAEAFEEYSEIQMDDNR